MFKRLDPVPNIPQIEKKVIKYWKKIDVVEKLKELRKDSEEKVYYDGPITANNMPHYGHAIQWTLKDLVPRYWSMKNYFVSRNMGWDCQGIPVEYEVEKHLGFEKKEDIEEFGVAKFNDLCKQSVFKYRDAIFEYETRLGRWFDESDMYYTFEKNYHESEWWALKTLYEKGLLYQGHKVVAYSTRAGTTLSTHEVNAGGYEEIEDPYLTVKFWLKDQPNTCILAWTTTPWTIPGNLLLGVGKDIEYAKVNCEEKFYIVAKDLVNRIFGDKKHTVIEKLSAESLLGLEYIPPFDYFEEKRKEGVFKVVEFGDANTEEGTGIVHLAPYGAEDFEVFMAMGITLFDYLDDTANFTEMIPEYKGMFYQKVNPIIIEDLDKKGLLFDSGKYVHRMPMCWRTNTPLIYKPIESWYIAVTKIKDRMIEENRKVNWVPEYAGTGIAGNWIENARDWALSRTRYWGTVLPLWVNDKTGEKRFIGSFSELEELSGVTLKDPHRPYVDEITWVDKKNGGTFKRIPDVIDVWFDSGAMPFAQQHYPMENKDNLFDKFPAEYICEMTEQARLWFYTMLVLGVALFDQVPYKNVVAHGVMLAEDGKKLSKSLRNFPEMDLVLDTYGGDVLRFFILNSPIVQAESARFNEAALADVRKEFFIPLWNSLKYFTMYADKYGFEPNISIPSVVNVLDTWILERLNEVIINMTESLDSYHILNAARQLNPLVNDLSTWYIRRSRDRISAGDQIALHTLYYVLVNITKLAAPFIPFITEEMYEVLRVSEMSKLDSVHFDLYPEVVHIKKQKSKDIIENMQITRDIVSSALSIRVENKLKVRQPLNELKIIFKDNKDRELFTDLILDEVNVKHVTVVEKLVKSKDYITLEQPEYTIAIDTNITDDLRLEGNARDMVRQFQDKRKKQKLDIDDVIDATFPDTKENVETVNAHERYIKDKILARSLIAADEYTITRINN